MSLKNEVQKWLRASLDDPIAQILRKNSTLTRTQLETLLIDLSSEKIADKRIKYEEKAKLRLLRSGVSRGSFNRTLRQSRTNVIRSLYTVMLLAYLGILESPGIHPYLEVANKLHDLQQAYMAHWQHSPIDREHAKIIAAVHKELEDGLKRLTEPKSMSPRT